MPTKLIFPLFFILPIILFPFNLKGQNLSCPLNGLTISQSSLIKYEGGKPYRDLNKNNVLDVYEDCEADLDARVDNVLSMMSLAEKAGMLFINGPIDLFVGLNFLQMNHFNVWDFTDLEGAINFFNFSQILAESTRLGIPVTFASDPRNHITSASFTVQPGPYSQWCETLGFGAIGDPEIVKEFAEISRAEFVATGFRLALHPQIDLATEPRWPRISSTFGEDANLTSTLAKSYLEGFQKTTIGGESVACMIKHFPGGGPQNNGLDPHLSSHQGQIYPGDNFDYHLYPFKELLESNPAAVMPYYGVPIDQGYDEVGFAFNKALMTDLLRNELGFEGIICTDWGLITDYPSVPARAWGVEHLSEVQRVERLLNAGIDLFGGESRPELVVQLVNNNDVAISRIDASVRRLLKLKFQLGLFDNPFVDVDYALQFINNQEHKLKGLRSQEMAMTLLKNHENVLPLEMNQLKIYIENIDSTLASEYAMVVSNPSEADFAIIRLKTPFQPASQGFFIDIHQGDLDFKEPLKSEILNLLQSVPTIVDIYLDRPAVIPEIAQYSKALLADFGASDEAVLNVIFGKAQPMGKLPVELPRSMEAVYNQLEDVPYDSEDPLFAFGFGLSYQNHIPALSQWGTTVLFIILFIVGVVVIRERKNMMIRNL